MGNKHTKSQPKMGYKPKALGNNAIQLVDEAQMAVSQVMMHASSVMTNDLTREGIYKAIGMILKEGAEAQKALTEVRYLGK